MTGEGERDGEGSKVVSRLNKVRGGGEKKEKK